MQASPAFVSTGKLPGPERIRELLDEAHRRYGANSDGQRSRVYPALAQVRADLFGLCVAGTDGGLHWAGDAEHPFTIMSVSKPFLFALVCQALGPEQVRRRIGVNATGHAFDSVALLDQSPDGRTNPMVNSGALAATSLVPGLTTGAKWHFIRDGLSQFAGRPLALDEEVYASASQTNHRNQGIAWLLSSSGRLNAAPAQVVELYTRQCSLGVSAKDLAVMAATLADGGINPITRARVVDAEVCHHTLAVMATAGMYETSGDWLYDVGVPGKSGIAGGIITVAPGKGGLATFAPLLDAAGHSIKGQLTARFLSRQLGMSLFISAPEPIPSMTMEAERHGRQMPLPRQEAPASEAPAPK
jgi:glutaminase